MKKHSIFNLLISIVLVVTLAFTLISCGNKNEEVSTNNENEIVQNDETKKDNDAEVKDDADKTETDNKKEEEKEDKKEEEKKNEDKKEEVKDNNVKEEEEPSKTPEPEKNEEVNSGLGEDGTLPEGVTFANYLLRDFNSIVKGNPSASAETIANELSQNEAIMFFSMAAPVEEGWLAGFDSDITGFEAGAMFGPAMGSIPFVGYVFDLADANAANAFISTLTQNANPRWQICVTAEETVCKAVGDKVFFVMAPLSNQ